MSVQQQVNRTEPSAAEPQLNKKDKYRHEEREGRKHFFKIRCPLGYPIFVSFAILVVRKGFVACRKVVGKCAPI
jgi:hypothetical protein